jgi:hypothetical protein
MIRLTQRKTRGQILTNIKIIRIMIKEKIGETMIGKEMILTDKFVTEMITRELKDMIKGSIKIMEAIVSQDIKTIENLIMFKITNTDA